MPFDIEHEGKTVTVWTDEEVTAEVKGLKITNENLKAEKQEVADKLKEAKDAGSAFEIQLAEAQGDKDKAERLAAEIKAEKEKEHGELLNTIKSKEIKSLLDDLVTKHGAGGAKNEDLRDLLRSRYSFDYDLKTGQAVVSGDGVSSLDELTKLVAESERYAGYRAGSGASGGGSLGNNGAGGALKKPSEMTGAERLEFKQNDPEGFKRAFKF